jgi:hypothetical protein
VSIGNIGQANRIQFRDNALGKERLNESIRIGLVSLQLVQAAGAPMLFLRTVPPVSGLSELQTFECRPCRLAITAEQVLQFPELQSPLPA